MNDAKVLAYIAFFLVAISAPAAGLYFQGIRPLEPQGIVAYHDGKSLEGGKVAARDHGVVFLARRPKTIDE